MSAPPFKSRIFNRVVESITAAWVSWFQEVGDFVGGVVTGVTSLFVEANSTGNVSRWVMETVAGSGSDTGYWSKLWTGTPDASINATINITLSIFDGKSNSGLAKIKITAKQLSSGLDAATSQIHVLYIAGSSALIAFDSFKLITASATNGSAIELWIQKKDVFGVLSVYEESIQKVFGVWSSKYNNGSTWTATTPSGAVNITSDWAGRGTYAPTASGETTAGSGTYIIQSGAYLNKNGRCVGSLRIGWSAHTGTGNLIISLPFTAKAGVPHSSVAAYYDALTVGAGKQLSGFITPGTNYVSLYASDPAGGAATAIAVDTAVTDIIIAYDYEV